MSKDSISEAALLELSEHDLKELALSQYEKKRRLDDMKKDDPQIIEHTEYMKETYSEPKAAAEKLIKLARRVFLLRGIEFNEKELTK